MARRGDGIYQRGNHGRVVTPERDARVSHGHTRGGRSREYRAWERAKARCFNPATTTYRHYGGRGITMWPAWRDSFETFLRDVGCSPGQGFSLDRINPNGHYEPGNVRWAVGVVQSRNTRRARLITFNGETLCLSAWAERASLTPETIHKRLARGWTVAVALTTPGGQ
jgi:hypothetical protein